MPVWRLQTEFAFDSALPRDRLVITPHFDDHGLLTDPQGLCDDLAAALNTWSESGCEVAVTAYDAQGAPPVYPQGNAVVNAGSAPVSSVPREVACCLSFYSTRNIPRQRGRLFIPHPIIQKGAGVNTGVRPNGAALQRVGDLAAIFSDLGAGDVDWCVYSRADDVARPVTNWWVDDEWDTVRSRGLRATTRLTGTTSEA